jgi:hypothetical protein
VHDSLPIDRDLRLNATIGDAHQPHEIVGVGGTGRVVDSINTLESTAGTSSFMLQSIREQAATCGATVRRPFRRCLRPLAARLDGGSRTPARGVSRLLPVAWRRAGR